MVDLVDGGEEFKRCFVLQALSSFLAPTTNRTVSLKLLKAVEKVDEIKTFDWCSYVLKKLKKAVQKYKDDETAQNVSGCLLALQIMYFHRLNFQGNKDVVPEKEPAQGFNENIPKDDGNGHGKIVNEGLNGSGPSAIIPGPTENIPVGHIDQNEPARRIFRANKSLCSLDCGLVGVQVCDNIGKGNISSAVKDLHDLWEGWVSYENPECDIMDADLCVQMGAFLGKRNHPKSSQLPSYGFEVVELEWRKEK
uniref:Uncharacterized protein n=1 Tax=Chenopodium quinoa TaxID=63459 RepID=A0A803MBQ5_CHEQI